MNPRLVTTIEQSQAECDVVLPDQVIFCTLPDPIDLELGTYAAKKKQKTKKKQFSALLFVMICMPKFSGFHTAVWLYR